MTVFFDMDGTIANLYNVDNWLAKLRASDATPYRDAQPMVSFSALARVLNRLTRKGVKVEVISWLAKSGNNEYNERVAQVKREWLAKHLPSVKFNAINIVKYGTPKQMFCTGTDDILFDDEIDNRTNWTGIAYDEKNILENLKKI